MADFPGPSIMSTIVVLFSGILYIAGIVLAIYLITLLKRFVKAVEKIADKLSSGS